MPPAPLPDNEAARLKALARYQILDTQSEEIFNRITGMARRLFHVPIALISLVDKDRQWFKSHAGLEAQQTSRDQAFCAYALRQDDVLIVEDATIDDRFCDNPLVTSEPNIRFYAGAQLVTHDGFTLGTLCIIDSRPRKLVDVDIVQLRNLASLAINEIELRVASANEEERARYTNRDSQTNTYNQRTFQKLFTAECARSLRHRRSMSLAILHLDQLDSIAHSHGEEAVDVIIESFRDRCKTIMRSQDILARTGAAEFAVMLPETSSDSAEIVMRRIIKHVAADKPEFKAGKLTYAISLGLASLMPNQRAEELYHEAEKNLNAAKSAGPNKYIISRRAFYNQAHAAGS